MTLDIEKKKEEEREEGRENVREEGMKRERGGREEVHKK